MAWEDQGLWFSLILNGVALAILIPISAFLHTRKDLFFARIFRPNFTIEPTSLDPEEELKNGGVISGEIKKKDGQALLAVEEAADEDGKKKKKKKGVIPPATVLGRVHENIKTSLFALPPLKRMLKVGEEAWESDADDMPLRRDPHADLFLFFLKFSVIIFGLIAFVSTDWLTLIYSFDNFNLEITETADPVECRGKMTFEDCDKHAPVCRWIPGFGGDGSGFICEPNPRNGLSDLSLQNVSPRNPKLYATGILAAFFGILTFFAFFFALRAISAYNTRVMKRQLKHAIGYRTVVVRGVACPPEKVLKEHTREVTIDGKKKSSKQGDSSSSSSSSSSSTPSEKDRDADDEPFTFFMAVDPVIPGYPASDPDTFIAKYLTAESYFGAAAEEEKEREEGDDADKENKNEKKDGRKNVRVGGFVPLVPIPFVSGKAMGPDDFELFKGRGSDAENGGVSTKIEDIIIEREAYKKFYDALAEYQEAKIAFQDVVAEERNYHEDLKKQREIAYDKIDKYNEWKKKKAEEERSNNNNRTSNTPDDAAEDDGDDEDKENTSSSSSTAVAKIVEFERETFLPPLMGRDIPSCGACCSKVPIVAYRRDKLAEKAEALNEAILANRLAPFCGSVFVIFKDAISAFEFVELFNAKHGGFCSLASAQIAGPHDKIEQINLAMNKFVSFALAFVMAAVFGALVLFWSIPVGFLGSLESLATIPGIGVPFQKLLEALPIVVVGVLSAYLPVIVLAVFNIVLPKLIRFFVVTSGSLTTLETDHGVMIQMYLFIVLTGVVFQAALQGGLAQLGSIISDPNQEVIFAFITSIISPKGGYWYATIITAGCLSMWINALYIAPLLLGFILSRRAATQRSYNGFFKRLVPDWPLRYAFTMLPTTIGFFFHVTVPFLGIFVGIFFISMYFVYRGILLDHHAPEDHPDRLVSNFRFTTAAFRIMTVLYLIAAVGASIVVALREHWGGFAFCIVAVAFAVLTLIITFYQSAKWLPTYNNVKRIVGESAEEEEKSAKWLPTYNNVKRIVGESAEEEEKGGEKSEGKKDKKDAPTTEEDEKKEGDAEEQQNASVVNIDNNDEAEKKKKNGSGSTSYTPPPSTPDAPYSPIVNDILDDVYDASPLGVATKQRKPFHSIHAIAVQTVDVEKDCKLIEGRDYAVHRMWHDESLKEKIAKAHHDAIKEEATELRKAIVAGTYEPAKPPAADDDAAEKEMDDKKENDSSEDESAKKSEKQKTSVPQTPSDD